MIRTADRVWAPLCALVMGCLLYGCGLLMDAAQAVKPVFRPVVPELPDELQVICRHRRLQVGIAVDQVPPFVFPAVRTDQGTRVTGLDIELVQGITTALSKHCEGPPVTPVLHLVQIRDLYVLLTEGQLDLFVSAVAYNIPHLRATGLGFSTPYYYDAGIGGITRRPEVVERVRAALRQPSADGDPLALRKKVLTGMIVAVQEGRSPHLYAVDHLTGVRLLVCDSFSAAFEFQDPPIDVILGKQPILNFIVRRERRDWQSLVLENGRPFLLTRELFTVVMAETNFRLQRLVNDLLFQLEESGRLAQMRRRWFEEDYAYAQRALSEGLLSMPGHDIPANERGGCHWANPP